MSLRRVEEVSLKKVPNPGTLLLFTSPSLIKISVHNNQIIYASLPFDGIQKDIIPTSTVAANYCNRPSTSGCSC